MQNGHVERLIGSIQVENLDHLIVFDEAQLRRILNNYASYDNQVQTAPIIEHERGAFSLPGNQASLRQCQSLADFIINTSLYRFRIGAPDRDQN
jgi:hypothetical protein